MIIKKENSNWSKRQSNRGWGFKKKPQDTENQTEQNTNPNKIVEVYSSAHHSIKLFAVVLFLVYFIKKSTY